MFAEDLNAIFAEGETATWTPSTGGPPQSAQVFKDAPGESVLGDSLRVSNLSEITYAAGQFVGLDEDELLVIGGVTYRVREQPWSIDDGLVMKALLSKV